MIVDVKGIEYEIDDNDYDFFKSYKWRIDRDGYLLTNIKNNNGKWTTKRYHRMIMNVDDRSVKVDHKDRNIRNNKRENLRLCDTRKNGQNRGNTKNSSSKYKGVQVKNNKLSTTYKAVIIIDGKYKSLGNYDNENIAGYVYNIYAQRYFEEFACLNDVDSFTSEEIENSRITKSKSNKNRMKVKV